MVIVKVKKKLDEVKKAARAKEEVNEKKQVRYVNVGGGQKLEVKVPIG